MTGGPSEARSPGRARRGERAASTDAPSEARSPGRARRGEGAAGTDAPSEARSPGRARRGEDAAGTDGPSEARRAGRTRRTGRRGGDSGTREAILAAARARFGDHGYDRTTIRGIAADAGVDAALVHHFYGSKEQLFAAAMRLPVNPREVLDAALAPGTRGQDQSLGEHLLRIVLGVWEVAEMRATFLGLLRSAPTSEQAVIMLREFLAGAIIGPLTEAARQAAPDGSAEDAGYRAALVASQVLGLGMTRYVLELPSLTQVSSDELVAAIAPNLDRYLSGDLQ